MTYAERCKQLANDALTVVDEVLRKDGPRQFNMTPDEFAVCVPGIRYYATHVAVNMANANLGPLDAATLAACVIMICKRYDEVLGQDDEDTPAPTGAAAPAPVSGSAEQDRPVNTAAAGLAHGSPGSDNLLDIAWRR